MKRCQSVTLVLLMMVSGESLAFADEGLMLNAHASSAQVKAHELVYSGSDKLSELIWDTPSTLLAGVDLRWALNAHENVYVNASYTTTLSKAGSVMDDYDWLVTGADWTHWSHHENTNLDTASILDINISKEMYASSKQNITAAILVGYRQDKWSWHAVGGTYIYSSSPASLRDTTGSFANVTVISYEQTMDTPYIGIDGHWYIGDLSVGLKLIGSTMVTAKDVDNHYLRALVFTDTFRNGNMLGADFNLAYAFSENNRLSINYHVQSYLHNRGDTRVDDQMTGGSGFISDSAGISLDYSTISLGFAHQF